jgi:hypothetical protein
MGKGADAWQADPVGAFGFFAGSVSWKKGDGSRAASAPDAIAADTSSSVNRG